MLTRIKQQVFIKAGSSETWAHYLKIAYDRTTKKIEEHKCPDNKFNEKLAIVFYKYRDILDASYHLLLSESKDLEKLIQFTPGFLVMNHFMSIPDVGKLLVGETSFLDLLERNRHFVNVLDRRGHSSPEAMLNIHLRQFLCDRDRSVGHYYNPKPHHLAICLGYDFTFNRSWSDTDSEGL